MKFIVESFNAPPLEFITEKKEDGTSSMYIEGIFMQSNVKNRNGRIYERNVLEPAIEKFIDTRVKSKRAIGELNHPAVPTIDPKNASHLVTELNWEKNDVIGKAFILNTPNGNIVRGLLEGGVQLGVSSRGMGSIDQREDAAYVKDDYFLSTIDIVDDPSAPSAFVNGIQENVEYIVEDNGSIVVVSGFDSDEAQKQKQNEEIEQFLTEQQLLGLFAKFLSKQV